MPTDRSDFLGVGFDRLTMPEVLRWLGEVTFQSKYKYVVTPNVDHVVRLDTPHGRELRSLYDEADLCVCDSRVLKLLARFHHIDLPLVPGSDLTKRLFDEVVMPGDTVAIVGASSKSLREMKRLFPQIRFRHYEAPMDLRGNAVARTKAAEFIAATKARFFLIAVGSPQQEMIAGLVQRTCPEARGAALCIGASLDFITGSQRRAPKFIQRANLEWAFRLLSEPRRLWKRYLVEGPRVFLLAARYSNRGSK